MFLYVILLLSYYYVEPMQMFWYAQVFTHFEHVIRDLAYLIVQSNAQVIVCLAILHDERPRLDLQ